MDVGDHLFRREAGRMVAALIRTFGIHNLALAEDVVQDAFCRALEVWKLRGVPDNPGAWLMATARHRAIDVLRRERTARTFAPEYGRLLESEWTLVTVVDELFDARAVKDDQLRMMFSCCHPRMSEAARVGLVLHILCGFSVNEVAAAFLDRRAATEKRILRAKQVLARSKRLFDLADADFSDRLCAVHRALYLLFNEGYHGASPESAVRVPLCDEAIRLMLLLVDDPRASTPATHALAALMLLNAGRLPARIDESGRLQSLAEQDRSRWDRSKIKEGERLLERAAIGSELTEYHLEAAIAAAHSSASHFAGTPWGQIVSLYDALIRMRPSPVVALNRAIAIGQHEGADRGLQAIRDIADCHRLDRYPFYFAAVGEFELSLDHCESAREHFQAAVTRARSPIERRFFQQRVGACDPGPPA